MIVGDISRFAVEFDMDADNLHDPTQAEWLFGRLRWWCGGTAVGRFESDTTLRDLANEAQRVRGYEGKRADRSLMSMSAKKAIQTVVDTLFVDHGQSEDDLIANEARYRRHIVRPMVEEFDMWDIFLFEDDQASRLVWRYNDREDLDGVDLAPGEFDHVLTDFVEELRRASVVRPTE